MRKTAVLKANKLSKKAKLIETYRHFFFPKQKLALLHNVSHTSWQESFYYEISNPTQSITEHKEKSKKFTASA